MDNPTLIIISGPSASGKTTIGTRLSEELNIPFFYKDAIKERLFDSLGWKDREWSEKVGAASYSILYYFIEELVKHGTSCIIESNFLASYDTAKLIELQKKYDCALKSIFCTADHKVLLQRFKDRVEGGKRHPGHVDETNFEFITDDNEHECKHWIEVGERVYKIDTTNFESLDWTALLTWLKS